jgi:error-prone DNA polymerase
VIEVALVAPGPIQGKMVHPYCADAGPRAGHPTPPELRAVFERTLGVPLFQEQVMQLAIVAADFTPARPTSCAARWRRGTRDGGMEHIRELMTGMAERGYDPTSPTQCSSRSRASAATASPNRTRPASR